MDKVYCYVYDDWAEMLTFDVRCFCWTGSWHWNTILQLRLIGTFDMNVCRHMIACLPHQISGRLPRCTINFLSFMSSLSINSGILPLEKEATLQQSILFRLVRSWKLEQCLAPGRARCASCNAASPETALRAVGVTGVPVTTAVANSILGVSYLPSHVAFSEVSAPVMVPLVSYLLSKEAPLLVNVYPYFAYAAEPGTVQLGYALLAGSSATSSSKVVSITDGGLVYTNMFDAIVDAAHAAVEKAGAQGLELVVSETGWPSGGGATGATVENTAAYNNNVVRHVASCAGTPRRPGKAVETYLFAMFNDNQKPRRPGKAVETYLFAMFNDNQKPEGTEQHFGLFQPDMTAVYPVDFAA